MFTSLSYYSHAIASSLIETLMLTCVINRLHRQLLAVNLESCNDCYASLLQPIFYQMVVSLLLRYMARKRWYDFFLTRKLTLKKLDNSGRRSAVPHSTVTATFVASSLIWEPCDYCYQHMLVLISLGFPRTPFMQQQRTGSIISFKSCSAQDSGLLLH